MIVVIVEHFLDPDGQAYFPDWINETREVLISFAGFLSLRRMEDMENSSRCVLILQFAELSLLRQWAKSQEHDAIVGKLDAFVVHKRRSQVFRIEE